MRVLNFPLFITFIYAVFLFIVITFFYKIPVHYFNLKILFIVLFICLAGYFFVLSKIKVESLTVDRWSVITSFLDSLLDGEFPYLAKSHRGNPPGPFPVYFLIAFPFYLIGEIGVFTVLGYIGLIFYINKNFTENRIKIILILLLLISPASTWELTVRSTILINMVLILYYIKWISEKEENQNHNFILPGILGGFLLSTRGIVALILLGFLSYNYLKNHKSYRFLKTGIFILLGFTVTLLPFFLWDAKLFILYNPITLQAGFLPSWIILIFIVLFILAGLKAENLQIFYNYVGVLLFAAVSCTFLINILQIGLYDSFIQSKFDISYFIFSIPFLLISIVKETQ